MYMKDYKYENTIAIAIYTKKAINKLIIIIPPLSLFLGAIWVIGIVASSGFEGWDTDKYYFIPAIFMMIMAIILFITFITMYHYQEKIISERRLIFDYDINKLVISPHGMNYHTIDLFDIEKIDCKYIGNTEMVIIRLKNKKVYKAPTNDTMDSFNTLEILQRKFNANQPQYTKLDENTIIY